MSCICRFNLSLLRFAKPLPLFASHPHVASYSLPPQNVYADVTAAYEYLTKTLNLHPSTIVLYGRSLGSGPSCYIAEKATRDGNPVGGVILQVRKGEGGSVASFVKRAADPGI